MKTGKTEKHENREADDVVDAKSAGTTEVATVQETAVSATVKVRGGSFEYATLMPFYTVCRLPQSVARECHEGDMLLKRGTDTAFRLCEPNTPVKAIVLDGQQAVLEGRPMGEDVPRVFAVGRTTLSGETPRTLEDCWRIAGEEAPEVKRYRFEDYSKATNPIPDHYFAEALYLRTLVQVPDSIPDAFSLVTVGGSIYVPAVILFKKFDVIQVRRFFNNIQVREAARHANDRDWTWSPAGQFVSVSIVGKEYRRSNGVPGTIWTPTLERLLGDDGMIYRPTDAERDDLTRLFMGLADAEASVDDVAPEEF